jgi:predicted cobalt transporter CbtA
MRLKLKTGACAGAAIGAIVLYCVASTSENAALWAILGLVMGWCARSAAANDLG